jgi:hypothetical protein
MIIHKEQAAGKWFTISLIEQLANIGSDVERTIKWKNVGNHEYSQRAFERVLELIDVTILDPKNKGRLKEVLLMREALVDYFVNDNEYKSSDELWQKYFYHFNYAASLRRGR